MLHQASEHYYRALLQVFDNENPKEHDLKVLISITKRYSDEIETTFPTDTEFDKTAFEMLYLAYSHARYDLHYKLEKEQYEYMLKGVEKLKELTYHLCTERLACYDELITKENETES